MNSGQHEQSPKVEPTVAIDERAEFEKWANKHKGGDPLKANENGSYPNPFANAAYEAWQAARKLSAPVLADETKKLYEELIYSVASKFPDETRHQTALRYIRNAEKGTSEKADQTRLQFSMLKSSPVSYSANASDAPQVSPVVPDAKDEIDHDGIWTNSDVAEQRYIQGWNDCRAAMQANCDAMLKGAK